MREVAREMPLVTGPKYPSFEVSLAADGVGEGEITRVRGTAACEDAMARDQVVVKSGRGHVRMLYVPFNAAESANGRALKQLR